MYTQYEKLRPQSPPLYDKQSYYDHLMTNAPAGENAQWLAQIVSSWLVGESELPDYLGLVPDDFIAMMRYFFPGVVISGYCFSGRQADFSRMPEKADLIELFHQHRIDDRAERGWIAEILVSACLGMDHLWQDTGLWNRQHLSALITHNFPTLANENRRDMKWKKFFYKQLCDGEGAYVCRAPSCDVCADFDLCFGPDE